MFDFVKSVATAFILGFCMFAMLVALTTKAEAADRLGGEVTVLHVSYADAGWLRPPHLLRYYAQRDAARALRDALSAPEAAPVTQDHAPASAAQTAPEAQECHEDRPCWDCATMGNRICGPTDTEPGDCAPGYGLYWDEDHGRFYCIPMDSMSHTDEGHYTRSR